MSYCRMPPSGAYVWGGEGRDGGFICCMACRLVPPKLDGWYHDFYFHSRTKLLEHLRLHRLAGHRIPRSAFRRLHAEKRKYGDSTKEAQADSLFDD